MHKKAFTATFSQYLPPRFNHGCFFVFLFFALSSFRWHRIAYSVQNKSVTLYLDCQKVETLDLLRGDDAVVSTDGIIVFGTRLLDEAGFEVGHYQSKNKCFPLEPSSCYTNCIQSKFKQIGLSHY